MFIRGLAQGLLYLMFEAVPMGDVNVESNRTFSVYVLRRKLVLSDSEKMVDASDSRISLLQVCLMPS